jgi:redox-sensitive bicupin YhaK (pirin superfamily)
MSTDTAPYILRKADDRGRTSIGWLDSRHSFSFGRYYDPLFQGFGPLLVINDDRVAASGGFGTHPHRDMEIISYVVSGELEHKDSIGTGSIIRPGDIQMMRAGTGIQHSEYNPSDSSATRFLQIWITPAEKGLEPGYQQARIAGEDYPDEFRLLISPDGVGDSLQIAQDARLYGLALGAGKEASLNLGEERSTWVQVVSGVITVDGHELGEGDGYANRATRSVTVSASQDADVLVFDLP